MGLFDSVSNFFLGEYHNILASVPLWVQKVINLAILIILIVLYALFIWKFYKFVSKKNIMDLDLKKYNTSEHPLLSKLFGGLLYLLEYLIIMPFLLFFWFIVFTIFLILLTEEVGVTSIITLSAAVIGAIRVLAYFEKGEQKISQEIAKLLPFTLLAISMITVNFFNFERIIGNIKELPLFLDQIGIYLLFILSLEIILRFFELIGAIFNYE